ncbi:DUF5658 family protein [Paenibacillus sp. HJGM_3]|uniref:DUF5658 family protein n=1 Tax=Paenibacillus sp. HJGM_3 TaxID=3379816 RepID=UPI00385EDAB1
MNRWLIAFVCLASLLDAFLTDVGLRLQLINEANPLMRLVYDNSMLLFYGCKIVLPLSLFFLVARAGGRLYIRRLFQLSVVVYGCVLLLHYYWISSALQLTA